MAWGSSFVHIALATAFVIVCAMNAKRVGMGALLVAAFAAFEACFALAFRMLGLVNAYRLVETMVGIDAFFTTVGATLAFVGFVILRR